MKIIKPSFEILEQLPGLDGIYQQIEIAGRTCYKSQRPEGKTAKDFVDNLIKMSHGAMLEHGTVYLKIPQALDTKFYKYYDNPYSKAIDGADPSLHITKTEDTKYYYITTNYRVILEHNWFNDLQYLCEPTEYHEKRVTVRFITSIGIGRELLRHRVFSFANESTRYCNYSKDKFNNEVTFIIPSWAESLQEGILEYSPFEITNKEVVFMDNCHRSEKYYFEMLKNEATPQQAREVLPLATKSELVMTGFVSDWKHVFDLRSSIAATGQPHPDMKALMDPLYKEFINKQYLAE